MVARKALLRRLRLKSYRRRDKGRRRREFNRELKAKGVPKKQWRRKLYHKDKLTLEVEAGNQRWRYYGDLHRWDTSKLLDGLMASYGTMFTLEKGRV